MLSNYVKTSVRKFKQAKAHALINVFGLTLGLVCALLLFQKLRFELSFDAYHPDADRLYRVVTESTRFDESGFDEGIPYPFFDAFPQDFPEIREVTIVDRSFSTPVIAVERPGGEAVRFKETAAAAFVEPDYFRLFRYEWLQGDTATALASPHSVVLSERLAEKYFGTDDPIGRTLTFDNSFDLTVTGVVRDVPPNTVLPIEMIISSNLGEEHRRGDDRWSNTSTAVQAYMKLPPGLTEQAVNRRLRAFVDRYHEPDVAPYLRYFLQPLREVHFDPRFNDIGHRIITRGTIRALGLIGVVLLLTACINFINLNVVLVLKRGREVGVRKMLGGTPRQIVAHFMTETALITGMALVLAFALAPPFLSLARSFMGEGFSVNVLEEPSLLGIGVVVAFVLTALSGLYPAVLLSRLSPTSALRSRPEHRPGAFLTLRRSLVVVQFAISQALLICTLVAVRQIDFLGEMPLGYETGAVIEFEIPEPDSLKLASIEEQLLQSAAVRSVTFSNTGATSDNTWGSNFHYEKGTERLEHHAQVKFVDEAYTDTYGMTLVAGEDLVLADSIDRFVVNEALVKAMGFATPEEALGTMVETWHWKAPVVGVVRNFNTNSLHAEIGPTILLPSRKYGYVGAVKIGTNDLAGAVAAVEKAWTAAFPDYVFEYSFLDDAIARLYENEQRMTRLIQTFALVAILIGCIGVFGLISYVTTQRTKEIGIRKVLGASVSSVIGLFTREFVLFVLIAFAVAAPVAYYVMQRWLEDFAYRIPLGPGLFVAGFAASLLIALGTIGFRTYRAAAVNPVDALRSE